MNKDLILREKLAIQRTILANQSTFLAFLRTSMYFLIAGISINNVINVSYGGYIEVAFVVVSFVLLVVGIWSYLSRKKLIKESEINIGNYKEEFNSAI